MDICNMERYSARGQSPGGNELRRERNLFSTVSMRSFMLPRISRYLTVIFLPCPVLLLGIK